MDSQKLFYFNLIVGTILLLYFLFGRSSKQPPPTRLKMRTDSSPPPETPGTSLLSPPQKELQSAPNPDVKTASKQSLLEPETNSTQQANTRFLKELSVFFMYNGHEWEAHQVLGIPQGANLEMATQAYQEALRTADPSSYEFLECAHAAIMKQKRKHRL